MGVIDVAALPRELPAHPEGWTKHMVVHINMGRKGSSATFEIRDEHGVLMPFTFGYNSGLRQRGFYLHGSDECLTWAGLRQLWPGVLKTLERLVAAGRDERALSEPLSMVVIYDHPKDSPNGFVVRLWSSFRGIVAPAKLLGSDLPSVEAARELVPRGMVSIGRSDHDDPVIAEVWL